MGPVGGLAGELFFPFERWLDAAITKWEPAHVCYMAPIRTSRDTTDRLRKLFGLTAVIDLVVERRKQSDMPDIRAHHSEDATVVKFLCGRSRWPKPNSTAKKKSAVMQALLAYGWDVKGDDDAADSLALLLYVENKLAPRQAAARSPIFLPAA